MSDTAVEDHYGEDRALTLRNRARLDANPNLLYWYKRLYEQQFKSFQAPHRLKILEIGSGVSPLERFYNNTLTSDVLDLDHLDYVFDCHLIDRFEPIQDESLDVVAMTNVIHHLKDPIDFLNKAAGKIKSGGRVIATEPYFSLLSHLIFTRLHHEPVDFDITEPVLNEIRGPLASANIALPWLIFFQRPQWATRLREKYEFQPSHFTFFSSIAYMVTGGISHRIPLPQVLYRMFFPIDLALSRAFPKVFASFFTLTLIRK